MIITNNVIHELIINKSRFITYLYKVKTENEVITYLNKLKKEYKDATHICYAYILPNKEKYFDDSEPNGTAGIPILEVLKKNNLTYIACFVIRYFGGIKLGSGGLVRAYSNSCSLALKQTNIKKIENLFKIKLEISYQDHKLLEKLITVENILEKEFALKIKYTLLINKEIKDKLDLNNINYIVLDSNYF